VVALYGGGTIGFTSLAPANPGAETSPALDGRLPPRFVDASAALADGRAVVLTAESSAGLFVYDPATNRYARFGNATIPAMDDVAGMARDPASNTIYVVAGQRPPGSERVFALTADGSSFTEVTTTGAPPQRSRATVAFAAGRVLLVGGQDSSPKNDVWGFDPTTKAWAKVATLPENRIAPAVATTSDGKLLVVGGYDAAVQSKGIASAVLVDPASGDVTAVETDGAWPKLGGVFRASAALRGGIVAVDPGESTTPQHLWRFTVEGGRGKWTDVGERAPYLFDDMLGVTSTDTANALFVGRSTWHFEN
jgi:hypothetical protein